jgi:hypothetical protein
MPTKSRITDTVYSGSAARLKKMAAFTKGTTLDVGFANLPNPTYRAM